MIRILAFVLYASVFLVAFPSIRLWDTPITLSDMLFIILLIVILLINSDLKIIASPVLFAWWISGSLIIVGLLVSSLAHSAGSLSSFSRIAQYMFAYLLLPFLFAAACRQFHIHIETVLKWCIWGFLTSTIIAVVAAMFFTDLYLQLVTSGFFPVEDRVGGFVGPNGLAKTLALLTPYIVWQIAYGRRYPFMQILFLLIFTIGVIGAASVAGIISFSFALILSLLVFRRAILRILTSISFILILSFFWIPFINLSPNERIASSINRLLQVIEAGSIEGASSYNIRTWLMEEAIAFISKSPIIGVGAGRYEELSQFGIQVHNTYLLLWCEGGVAAFVGILSFATFPLIYAVFQILINLIYIRNKNNVFYEFIVVITSIIFCLNIFTNTNSFSRFTVIPLILIVLWFIEKENEKSTTRQTAIAEGERVQHVA
jgi:O-antigen ligase